MPTWNELKQFTWDETKIFTWDQLNRLTIDELIELANARIDSSHGLGDDVQKQLREILISITTKLLSDAVKGINLHDVLVKFVLFIQSLYD